MTTINQDYATALRASVATRRAYEISKNADCASMLKHLSAYEKRLTNDAVVALCESANVDSNVLNRQERNNARFNIYAFDKVLDDVSSATMNHYTKAILRAAMSLAKLDSDKALTHADAVFVCTQSAKHRDVSRAKVLKSAQYAKHVALNTASTQSSSSINSLCALNVLTESRDSANHVCYTLADNDFSVALQASLNA